MINTIRVERAKLAISQADLADAIGITRQAISSIENRRYVPSTVLALKIAQFFGTTVEEVFQLEDSD